MESENFEKKFLFKKKEINQNISIMYLIVGFKELFTNHFMQDLK
jgi:hypothetical protein